MELNHLTDYEIQDLLDGNRLPNEDHLRRHLESCDSCRCMLEQYQLLYSELSQPVEAALNPGFAQRMADKFEAAYAGSRAATALERLIWTGVGLAAAIAVYFFVGLSALTHIFEGFGFWRSLFSTEQLAAWAKLLQDYQIDPSVLVMAAVTLLLFGNMDSIIRHFRNHPPMCM